MDLANRLRKLSVEQHRGFVFSNDLHCLKKLQKFFCERLSEGVLYMAADLRTVASTLDGMSLEQVWLEEFFPHVKGSRSPPAL